MPLLCGSATEHQLHGAIVVSLYLSCEQPASAAWPIGGVTVKAAACRTGRRSGCSGNRGLPPNDRWKRADTSARPGRRPVLFCGPGRSSCSATSSNSHLARWPAPNQASDGRQGPPSTRRAPKYPAQPAASMPPFLLLLVVLTCAGYCCVLAGNCGGQRNGRVDLPAVGVTSRAATAPAP